MAKMSLLGGGGRGVGVGVHLTEGQPALSITKLGHEMSLLGVGGNMGGFGVALRCLQGALGDWGMRGFGVRGKSDQRSA